MLQQPFFSFTADPKWILGEFIASLLILHLLFLKVWKLSDKGIKMIDYWWLGMVILTLVASTGDARKLVAQNQLAIQYTAMVLSYDRLKDEIHFLHGLAVSRKFIRTELSPANPNSIQNEYDRVAAFTAKIERQLPSNPTVDLKALKISDRPKLTDNMLIDTMKDLDRCNQEYIDARKRYDETEKAQKNTGIEVTLAVYAPLLLAIALALRITKVTLELRK